MSIKAFKSFQNTCKNHIDGCDVHFKEISEPVKKKLDKYALSDMKDLPTLAYVIDPRFSNDIIENRL